MSESSLKKLEEQYDANAEDVNLQTIMTIQVMLRPDGQIELGIEGDYDLEKLGEALEKVAQLVRKPK